MSSPLADRLRPVTPDEIVGQKHILGVGAPLFNLIERRTIPNLIFYGPSGTGKTTAAEIAAKRSKRRLYRLNGTTASIADIREIVSSVNTVAAPNGVLLYLDEIQYFNKKQQQSLLRYIEDGSVTLIASTTENPYFYIYPAVLSRCTVFEFKPVEPKDVETAVKRAFSAMEKETGARLEIQDGVIPRISASCSGDVRKAINTVEVLCLSAPEEEDGEEKKRVITLEDAELVSADSSGRYDRGGDEHYDLLSAFQKSMRGSDPDASLHYLGRLLDAGDLISASRRLMVTACEDVGLAYPMIIPIVKAAVDAAFQVGLPEARIPLADACVLVATSPKSNSAYKGINEAMADIEKGLFSGIPRTLQNMHYDADFAEIKGQNYVYPHDFPNHWIKADYLPEQLRDKKYYEFGDNRIEQAAKAYWDNIKNAR